MSTISVRLPESLHKKVKHLAKEEATSINQLISSALAEKIAVLDAEAYLQKRSTSGDRTKFQSVLKKVRKNTAPQADDTV